MKSTNMWKWLWITWEIIFYYITAFIWDKKKQQIPHLEKRTYILMKGACDIVENIKSRKLKSIDLVTAVIERIASVNPIINAVTAEGYSLALKDARNVDHLITNSDSTNEVLNKPLLGVPFTVQESLGVRDMFYTMGLVSRSHLKAAHDSTSVKLLKDAGAILVAVSNVPEIDLWLESRNIVFGQTCNPHHPGRTVGGSGGGEAALVSSICAPFGICRDVAGSSLMAASFCGVFSHCPTPSVVISNGIGPNQNKNLTPAIIARNVEDLTIVTKVLSGGKIEMGNKVDISNIKFYYADLPTMATNDSINARKYLDQIFTAIRKETGKDVINLKLDKIDQMPFLYRCWVESQVEENSCILTNRKGKVIGILELIKKALGFSRHTLGPILSLINYPHISENDISAAEATLTNVKNKLTDILGLNGVLLLPTGLEGAPYHYTPFFKREEFSFWSLPSLIQCPATQVPIGTNEDGLPISLQILGSPFTDALCLETASYFEKLFGGFVSPCETYE